MIMNAWERVRLYCLNHDEPVLMVLNQNLEKIKTPFYMCGEYLSTPACSNRLNLDDYQGICFKLFEIIDGEDFMTDYTNYSFEYKGPRQKIFVKILEYNDDVIKIGILNKTVLGVK